MTRRNRTISFKGPIMQEVRKLQAASQKMNVPAFVELDEHNRISTPMIKSLVNWVNQRGQGPGELAEMLGVNFKVALEIWDRHYPNATKARLTYIELREREKAGSAA